MEWLTTRQVSERTGLSLKAVRQLMQPDYPGHIPHINIRTMPSERFPNGRPRYRISSDVLDQWQAARSSSSQPYADCVKGCKRWQGGCKNERPPRCPMDIYDPEEDSDSELCANPEEEEEP